MTDTRTAATTVDRDLEGRVAVVTGSAKGIGRAISEALAARGATVVISDLDLDRATETASQIDGADADVCDVTDEAQVEAMIAGTVQRHGRLDIAVANAGIASLAPLCEMPLEQWREMMSINLDGVFLTDKHAGRAMIAAGTGGSIVNIASVTATAGTPLVGHYAAAKAAVVNLTKTLAVELRPAAVRVNAILPGFAVTDLLTAQQADFESMLGIESMDDVMQMKQGGYVELGDIAAVAAFLASDRSRFCTGGGYVVDGGLAPTLL